MKFTAIVTALIALVAPAAAFVPTGGARTRGLTTIKMGYVPDGLTPAQYKALKAKEEAQAKANKKKAMVRPYKRTVVVTEIAFRPLTPPLNPKPDCLCLSELKPGAPPDSWVPPTVTRVPVSRYSPNRWARPKFVVAA